MSGTELFHVAGVVFSNAVNGGAEQFFQAGFAQGGAKPSNLGGIAGWAWLEVLEACNVLPFRQSVAPVLHR